MSGDGQLPGEGFERAFPEGSEPGGVSAVQVFDAYLARIEAGHAPDPERLLAEHPEIAEQLRGFLYVANQIGQIAGEPPLALDDYEIIREIGRGGMGIVYEAEQRSRGRRVALKILSSAAAFDPRRLKRFQNEARAAQLLRHAHIVPVSSFGCEQGVYSYAMQFIEGQNLAELIEGLRRSAGGALSPTSTSGQSTFASGANGTSGAAHEPPPTAASGPAESPSNSNRDRAFFERAARWAMQAAEALDYAHDQGVVHRDIKPSNLLIDTHGNLWLTDFGLALIGGEEGLSRTGDLVGTLRYMSPEQALGKRVVVDGRTDIYSLGVTFYELLTLRPACDGRDRQEVLRQIAQEEPPSPRRICAEIPRNLETIVLKAMAKEREDRYATARELADDLKRVLEERPIRARPPSLLDRLTRWARHHRPAVATAFLMLVVAVVALGAGTLLVAREQRRVIRESLMQKQQQVRLSVHTHGWSDQAWSMVRDAAAIQGGDEVLGEATATLAGLDARLRKKIPIPARSLAFDRATGRLLIGGMGQGAALWHAATGKTETFPGDGSGPVAFRPDGTPVRLVLEGPAAWRRLQLRDLNGVEPLARFEVPRQGEPEFLTTGLNPEMALAPDASLAAMAVPWSDGTGEVFVWDGTTGTLRHQFPGRVEALAFSPDASLLAAGDRDGRITVWSLASGQITARLQRERVAIRCVAFGEYARQSPAEGSVTGGPSWLLAAGDAGGTVVIWDLGAKLPRAFCHGSHYDINGMAFAPDGSSLASCGRDDVRLWDIATGRLLLRIRSGNHLNRPTFSADGRLLAVLSGTWATPEDVRVWALENGRGIRFFGGLSSQVANVRFSPDGNRLAALAHDWRVALWDHPTGRLLHVFDVPRGLTADNAALAFSADSTQFAFCAGQEAKLWDVGSGRELSNWHLPPGMVDHLGFHPSGKLLLFRMETRDGKVIPFDPSSPREHPRVLRIRDLLGPDPLRPFAEIDEFNEHVYLAAASLDGAYFVAEGTHLDAAGRRRSIRAFDGPTGKEVWSIPVPKQHQYAQLAADPTGEVVAVLTDDRSAELSRRGTLIDLRSGRPRRALVGVPADLGPGGNLMILRNKVGASGRSESFGVFGRNPGRPLAIFATDEKASSVLNAFSHDGRYLAWGTTEGSVFVADLAEVQRRLATGGIAW
jgi:serine/threonine protein kinase/WD40 repeat protein